MSTSRDVVIDGAWYGVRSSRRLSARCTVNDQGWLSVVDAASGEELYSGEVTASMVSSRLGNTARYLKTDQGRFETVDNDAMDSVVKAHCRSSTSGLAHKLESHKRFILLTAVVMLFFGWAMVAHGIPGVARIIAYQVPDAVASGMTREVMEVLDRSALGESQLSADKRAELDAHFAPLLAAYPDLRLKVLYRDGGPIGANAMALPDGTMIFTDQLVEMAEHPDELASILFHEIGHVHYRHGIQNVARSSIMAIAWAMLLGDGTAAAELLLYAPVVFSELSFSRKFEYQADDFARQAMMEHGRDPKHFGRIMLRLTFGGRCDTLRACQQLGEPDENRMAQYLSTHPPTLDRVERFTQ